MNAVNILQWEFEYARTTASEAMRDRHTMGNYYLVAVGIVASAVVALLNPTSGLPAVAGALVLAVLCIIGCFYFANIIRLRQAWRGSAEAMNRIKRFCIENQLDFNSQKLECLCGRQTHCHALTSVGPFFRGQVNRCVKEIRRPPSRVPR